MTDGNLYKHDDKKGWILDIDKVNKLIFDFKELRKELQCEDEDFGHIDCDNCPFYNVHHCNIFRTNIDAIRPMEEQATVDKLRKANSKLRQIERLLQPFSHHAGDEGYAITLDAIMIKKLQKIFSERSYED